MTTRPGYAHGAPYYAYGQPYYAYSTAFFFGPLFFFEKKTAQNLKIWSQKTKFDLIWGQGGRFRPYFALYRP